jgi:AraC-like DNA-binding protein
MPLARHPLVRTCSIDEGSHIYSSSFVPVRLESGDRASFQWHGNHAAVGPLGLTSSRYGGSFVVRAADGLGAFSLLVSRGGRSVITEAGRALSVDQRQGAILHSPSASPRVEIGAGFECVGVTIRRDAVETALATFLGKLPRAPLRFERRVQTTGGPGASVVAALDFLIQEIDRESGALSSPVVSKSLTEAFLYNLIWSQPHNHSSLVRAPAPAGERHYVHRVEEYLAAYSDRPIALADLTSLTGLSGRSIQAAFRALRGYSPMQFLRARRFERARKLFLSLTAKTVTEVAFDCGFEHVGRFSVEYRARFGESPKETRRRALGEHRRR